MQINLIFRGQDVTLPLAHKYQVQSLLYGMLGSDRQYGEFLHSCGYGHGERKFKFFTFGDLYGRYTIEGKNIIFHQGFLLQVRSPKIEFINALLRAAYAQKSYRLCGNELLLEDVQVDNQSVYTSAVSVSMLSPVTVYTSGEDGRTRYFSPEEPAFYEAIAVNTANKISAAFPEASAEPFSIAPLGSEWSKIVTTYKGIFITAWRGCFNLQASPAVLSFLYNAGIGAKNAQGFGMFEVIQA